MPWNELFFSHDVTFSVTLVLSREFPLSWKLSQCLIIGLSRSVPPNPIETRTLRGAKSGAAAIRGSHASRSSTFLDRVSPSLIGAEQLDTGNVIFAGRNHYSKCYVDLWHKPEASEKLRVETAWVCIIHVCRHPVPFASSQP